MELPLANIEQDQEFDDNLIAQLAEVLSFLPNLED